MANRFYIPGGTNDWNDTARWSATDGGATGAAVPVSTDDVYFKQGTSGPLLNLNQSGVTLNSLNILKGFGGTASGLTFGTDANAVQISATTVVIDNDRVRQVKLAGTYTTLNVRSLAAGKLLIGSGAITTAYLGRTGTFEIGDDVEVTTLKTAGMSGTLQGDSTSPVDLALTVSRGANIDCWRKVHTLVNHGTVTMANAAEGSASAGTSFWYNFGRLLLWQSGNVVNIETFAGSELSAVDAPGYATAPTLTNLYAHEGASVLLPTAKLTVTNKFPVGNIQL